MAIAGQDSQASQHPGSSKTLGSMRGGFEEEDVDMSRDLEASSLNFLLVQIG